MPLIANIIENAGTWRRALQEKVADLSNEMKEEPPEDDGSDSIRQHNPLHRHLWTLLKSHLSKKVHIQSAARKAHDDLEATPDDALPLPSGDEGAELLDYGYDDWEQDETQQSAYWAMQLAQDMSDYEPAEAEDNYKPVQEYIDNEMENESEYPDSEGPYDDLVYDDINPDHLHAREDYSQLKHSN